MDDDDLGLHDASEKAKPSPAVTAAPTPTPVVSQVQV
jgi:hypothetical protein